jgi:ComF family protein
MSNSPTTIAVGLLDLFWPRNCFGCGIPLRGSGPHLHFCSHCVGSIDFIFSDACPRCARPHFEDNRGNCRCKSCEKKNFAFQSCRALFELNGLGRKMIHELKYRNGKFLLPDIGRMSRVLFRDLAGKVLVPVPLHWRRRMSRGFNQSSLICKTLAREHGCTIASLLRRSRHTSQQVGLGGWENRRRNVDGAFALARYWPGKKKIAKTEEIFLVDDVLTTGATMDACARVLSEAGFERIHALALARG